MPLLSNEYLRLPSFPNPTWEMEAVVCDGDFYLVGGMTSAYGAQLGWVPNRYLYKWDANAQSWLEKTPVPVATHHMCVTELDGCLYLFGGFEKPALGPDDWKPVANAWCYNTHSDKWTQIAPLPIAKGACSATALNGKIYVAGGAYSCSDEGNRLLGQKLPHASTAQVDVYDPKSNTYTAIAPMLTCRNHHMLEAVNGRLYAIAGRVGSSNIWFANKIDLIEEYDPLINSWIPKSRTPILRSAMAGGIYNGCIYIAGGEGITAIDKFDPSSNEWSVPCHLPEARLGLSGAIVGSQFMIAGGHRRTEIGSIPISECIAIELNQLS